MTEPTLDPFAHPPARQWTAPGADLPARAFHESLPGYRMTPLTELPALAAQLGIARLFVKDESNRLGMPAFKILGASWAVARALGERLGVAVEHLGLEALRDALGSEAGITLVTATDGNHGRAVAHVARLLGLGSRVYLPNGPTREARDAIRAEGAELVELDARYDDAVAAAAASVVDDDRQLLVQDTAWPGYTRIPAWIVAGYETLFAEIDEQLAAAGAEPHLVSVPVGVGSLAEAAVAHYRGASPARPVVLSVEPATAACVLQSLHAGRMVSVDTSFDTIMKGLNCGTPSAASWEVFRQGLDAAVAVTDDDTVAAMRDLEDEGVNSGACGAASLAGVRSLLRHPERASELGVGADSVVVLVSTEARARRN